MWSVTDVECRECGVWQMCSVANGVSQTAPTEKKHAEADVNARVKLCSHLPSLSEP